MIRTAVLLLVTPLAFSQTPPYKDTKAPMEKRVDDLVSRMTLEEKISQLMNDSPAIDRLGVPAYNWWNECLHGVARAGRATVFPEAIGLAATWDIAFMLRVATAISDEARAKHHEAWYPGQAGGVALADVLFGDYNPAGRLPVTFYKSVDQLPAFTDYSMKGRTYRFFKGQPLFRFGYGLSYTTFAYSHLSLPSQPKAGDEVVQLYVKPDGPAVPIRSLEGFERVALRPKERKTVQFRLLPRQFASVTSNGRRVVQPGTFEISVGGITEKLRFVGSSRELSQ